MSPSPSSRRTRSGRATPSLEADQGALAPVVKWAGGKRQLLTALMEQMPSRFGRYLEPFVGGGALFFELCRQGRLEQGAVLCDSNLRLITLYQVLRDQPEALIGELEARAQRVYRADYLEARREFNRRPPPTDLHTAALFLYLNRLCFNGLFRVNRRGDFNVPFGRYANPDVVRAPALRTASRALRQAELLCGDFEQALEKAAPGDFVYFDPPYAPISPTSSFTAYDGPFGWEHQVRLADACRKLAERGVGFILSNSYHPEVLELYRGFELTYVQARRNINSVADKRGLINEIIVRHVGE